MILAMLVKSLPKEANARKVFSNAFFAILSKVALFRNVCAGKGNESYAQSQGFPFARSVFARHLSILSVRMAGFPEARPRQVSCLRFLFHFPMLEEFREHPV